MFLRLLRAKMAHRHNSHSKHHSFNGKNFAILPIIFCAGILAITYFTLLLPSASAFVSVGSLFFSDRTMDFSEEFNNIFVPVTDPPTESQTEKRKIPASEIEFPKQGEQFGEIIIKDCQIDARLFFGDDNIALNNGVGIYPGSSIPGYGKTILAAGHNNTYFNGLKYAKKGQKIEIKTSYGNFFYEITDIKIKDHTDASAYDLEADYENLILYTCYPFDELGLTPQRCFVYAKPAESNLEIDKKN